LKDPPQGFNDNDVLILIGRAAEKHGNSNFAMEIYRKIHGKPSNFRAWISSPNTWKQFANRLEDLGAYSSALDMLRRAFELVAYFKNTSTDTWWFMLAELLDRVGSEEEAANARYRARDVELRVNFAAAQQAFSASNAARKANDDMSRQVLGLVLSNCAFVATASASHATQITRRAEQVTKQALELYLEKQRKERELKALSTAIRNAVRFSRDASKAAILAVKRYETFEEREAAMAASKAASNAASFATQMSNETYEHVCSIIEARTRAHFASIVAWKACFSARVAYEKAFDVALECRERRLEALRTLLL
jgi:tetratricopeptide (TPR) repeat protein